MLPLPESHWAKVSLVIPLVRAVSLGDVPARIVAGAHLPVAAQLTGGTEQTSGCGAPRARLRSDCHGPGSGPRLSMFHHLFRHTPRNPNGIVTNDQKSKGT